MFKKFGYETSRKHMQWKPATQNEQFKYTDVLYYRYLYVLSVKLHKTSLKHNW